MYESTSVSRSPEVPASTTVVMRLGSCGVPEPDTVWLAGVKAVRGLALPPAGIDAGP